MSVSHKWQTLLTKQYTASGLKEKLTLSQKATYSFYWFSAYIDIIQIIKGERSEENYLCKAISMSAQESAHIYTEF